MKANARRSFGFHRSRPRFWIAAGASISPIPNRPFLGLKFAANPKEFDLAAKIAKSTKSPRMKLFFALCSLWLLSGFCIAAGPDAPDSQHQVPPTEPEKALAGIRVPEGFEITLFASEPQIRKPIAMAFDERGRMVIAEAHEYPLGPAPGEKPSDTIKILEDTDGDGKADKISVFADGLNIPDAVACGHGGIYVAEAPNLWFMQDTDGDGKADVKKKS